MTLSERIKRARKKAKLSQRDLARLLLVSAAAVGAWETGIRKPNASHLELLPKACRISAINFWRD